MNRMFPPRQRFTQAFGDLASDMEQLMDRVIGERGLTATAEGPFIPNLDISETDKAYHVEVDLPGVNPEEVSVEVEGDQLTIAGRREAPKAEAGQSFHRRERCSGGFRRSVLLPTSVDRDSIEAEYRNGVLRVMLPKAERVLPRRIQIKAEGAEAGPQQKRDSSPKQKAQAGPKPKTDSGQKQGTRPNAS